MAQNNPTEIITHHSNGTVVSRCEPTKHHNVLIVDDAHRERWPGFTSSVFRRFDNGQAYHCGYHFVIYKGAQGWRYIQTRAIWEEGAHCIGRNTNSIGVLFVGNYDRCSGEMIEDDAIAVWRNVYEIINQQVADIYKREIPVTNVYPHRRYAQKSCHGDALPDSFFANAIAGESQVEQLREQISTLQKLVEALSALVVQLVNRSTPKRLSLREIKNNA